MQLQDNVNTADVFVAVIAVKVQIKKTLGRDRYGLKNFIQVG